MLRPALPTLFIAYTEAFQDIKGFNSIVTMEYEGAVHHQHVAVIGRSVAFYPCPQSMHFTIG